MFLPALFFAGLIALTNLGLKSVAANVTVLLRASSLVWLIAFSFFLKSERPRVVSVLFALVVTAGVAMLSVTQIIHQRVPWIAILVNLLSALCTAAMVLALRSSIKTLRNRALDISLSEITFFKMAIAFCLLIPPWIIVEGIWSKFFLHEPKVWSPLVQLSLGALSLVLGGVALTTL